MRKKKNKKTVADTGYKKVDRKEKKKKEKQEEKRRQKKLSVQQSIAYKEMGRDGICRVQGKTYSKCIRFYDINYQLAQNEDKNAIFENWCDFLNYFDSSIHFQLSFINHKSSMKEFEQVIRIRPQEDAFDDVRMEYAKMLKQQLAKGNNGLVKSKYITFSIEADNIREAKPKLERIESDILNNFKILGVPAYPLNGVERLQILYETFNPDIMTDFQFDYGSMIRTGLNTKDYVAPTSFVFRDRNTFQMGNTIGAVSYLQILAPELTDKMLAEFLDIDKNLIVNLHVQSVDQMKAIKLVKSKVTDINRMKIEEQKKAVRAGYDMDIIPSDLNTYGGEAKRLLEDLQSRNERMFLVTALFLNTAKTKQALDNAIFQTAGIAQKYNCVLKRLDYQQEEGLMSSVPLGVNHIPIKRALTTTSTAIFVPFGLPLGDGAIRGPLKKLIEDYNLPPVVFHSFRHSSVTYKLKLNGGDIKAVQGDSGHAQVNMVTDVYSHILDDDRRKNAELFEEAFYEKKNLDPQMHVQQENNNATVADEVDPELLAKVLANPEMRALLNSLAKTMK